MYCKKCGKFIGNEADLCDECVAREAANAAQGEIPTPDVYCQPQVNEFVPQEQVRLGRAIAAMILADIGFIFVYIAFLLTAAVGPRYIGGAVAGLLIGAIPSIFGLIFGIKSITNFKATAALRTGKRIPVLILGIMSVVTAGIGVIFVLIALMVTGTFNAVI